MSSIHKFTGKADFYHGRPTYPKECIDYLIKKFDLSPNSVVADVGSGPGILARPFLDYGCSVLAVEPNVDMFRKLKENLSCYKNISFFQSTAEETKISSDFCDAVTVGMAFHWFDCERFRSECQRILKGEKFVAILNILNNNESDKKIRLTEQYTEPYFPAVKNFFGKGFIEHIQFEYEEKYDENRFVNEILSYSTTPLPSDPRFDDFVVKLRNTYRKYHGDRSVMLPFLVNCHIGCIK